MRKQVTTILHCELCGSGFTPTSRSSIPQRFCSPTCRNKARIRPIEDRFWEKVSRTDDPDQCWVWMGGKCGRGYGNLWGGSGLVMAHRFSYRLHLGPIPDGMMVCHRCDNPPCVNPAHLFLGSSQENIADMYKKGRNHIRPRVVKPPARTKSEAAPKGIAHHNAKITPEIVRDMRRLSAEGWSKVSIGVKYGVSSSLVGLVVRRKLWGHVE